MSVLADPMDSGSAGVVLEGRSLGAEGEPQGDRRLMHFVFPQEGRGWGKCRARSTFGGRFLEYGRDLTMLMSRGKLQQVRRVKLELKSLAV